MTSRRRPVGRALAFALAGLLGACAAYEPRPLPNRASLAPGLSALEHDGPLPARLGVEDVARLALLNDPDLRGVRARHDVASAQLLQAGLLPNPQASLSATPTLAGPGTTTAWNIGATEDLRSLILRPSARRAARAGVRQVDAEILWAEWQVVGQARLLAVQLIEGRRTQDKLRQVLGVFQAHVDERRRALLAGDATYATIAPDLAALAQAQTQVRDGERLLLSQKHALAALLGLQPDAPIPLAATAGPPGLDEAAIRAALPDLPAHRPDLLALRWGYEGANQKLRTAILSQFPNISFGPTGGSDNSNVRAFGPQLTLELPIFDRGQGNIAIARATRAQLRAEYTARIAATDGELRSRLAELDQLRSQIRDAEAALPAVQKAAAAAQAPDVAGLIDPQARVDLLSARLTREIEMIALEQARLSQVVAIETLAGIVMPEQAATPRNGEAS